MPSSIFSSLLDEKIATFINAFNNTATKVFYDEVHQRLIHPGEFGMYREAVVREFLRYIVPQRLNISTGFVLTSGDKVSTQCDIVIFDSENTPLVEDSERQRFFPVETVCGIGEVKSKLSKSEFGIALNKLARVKVLKESSPNPSIVRRDHSGRFNPEHFAWDQIPSFIICQKLDFDISEIVTQIDGMYESDILRRNHHNLVLSIEDGLILYADPYGGNTMFSEIYADADKPSTRRLIRNTNAILTEGEDKYGYFRIFCSYLFMLTSSATILYPDITNYMEPSRTNFRWEARSQGPL